MAEGVGKRGMEENTGVRRGEKRETEEEGRVGKEEIGGTKGER